MAQKKRRRRRRKKNRSKIIFTGILLAAVCVIVITAVVLFQKRSEDPKTYFSVSGDNRTALVVNGEVLEEQGVLSGGSAYVDYDTCHAYFNAGFYWEEATEELLLTLPEKTYRWAAGDVLSGGEAAWIRGDDGSILIAEACIREYSDIDMDRFEDPARIVAWTDWKDLRETAAVKDTQLRDGSSSGPLIREVKEGERLILLPYEDGGTGFLKASTEDGFTGFLPAGDASGETAAVTHETDPKFVFDHVMAETPVIMAWHYVDSMENNGYLGAYLDDAPGINTISPTWFTFAAADGTLVSYASADYVNECHARGIRVWPLLGDVLGSDVKNADVLKNPDARANVISQLVASAQEFGFDGINIDLESIPRDLAPAYLQFLRELSVAAHQSSLTVSSDNYVPTYTRYYRRAEQAKTVDYIIVMAYDEHTARSEEIGSASSITFFREGIADTLAEVPASQLIAGIPFYSRVWIETFGVEGHDSSQTSVAETKALGRARDHTGLGRGRHAVYRERRDRYTEIFDMDGREPLSRL